MYIYTHTKDKSAATMCFHLTSVYTWYIPCIQQTYSCIYNWYSIYPLFSGFHGTHCPPVQPSHSIEDNVPDILDEADFDIQVPNTQAVLERFMSNLSQLADDEYQSLALSVLLHSLSDPLGINCRILTRCSLPETHRRFALSWKQSERCCSIKMVRPVKGARTVTG
jgi:hypothetical protein